MVNLKKKKIGSFNVSRLRGRKPVSVDRIKEVALHVEENKAINVHASTIICRVAAFELTPRSSAKAHCVARSTLNTSYPAVWQKWICRVQLYGISYGVFCGIIRTSFSLCRNFFHMISTVDTCSHFNFLLALKLIQKGLGISSGQMTRIFI